jgi:hypothetical protein
MATFTLIESYIYKIEAETAEQAEALFAEYMAADDDRLELIGNELEVETN